MPIKTSLPYKYNITFLAVSQDYVKSKLKITVTNQDLVRLLQGQCY